MRYIAFTIIIYSILKLVAANSGEEKILFSDQNNEPLFSFGLIADVQYAESEPAGTRRYKSSLKKLKEAVTDLRNDSVDFVVNLGDLIDKDLKSYEPVLKIMDSSSLRFYHVTGNHDFAVDPKHKKRLPVEILSKPGYYSFMHCNFRFIILNGNEISTYSTNNKKTIKRARSLIDSLKSTGEPNGVEWNGGIGEKQLIWLNSQLNDASLKNEKVFLFCHFPVYPANIHNLLNYKDLLHILKNYNNIVAWFSGHNHAGAYSIHNQTHFVTIKGMVETDSQNSFARIDVYRNKLWIAGSGREKVQILAY